MRTFYGTTEVYTSCRSQRQKKKKLLWSFPRRNSSWSNKGKRRGEERKKWPRVISRSMVQWQQYARGGKRVRESSCAVLRFLSFCSSSSEITKKKAWKSKWERERKQEKRYLDRFLWLISWSIERASSRKEDDDRYELSTKKRGKKKSKRDYELKTNRKRYTQ